jgi:hypothetical protein
MTTGKGIAAARARIEAAFRALHGDCRHKAQVADDNELRKQIQIEPAPDAPSDAPATSVIEPDQQQRTEMLAAALVNAALRSPLVPKQTPRRGNVDGAWLVEAPTEDAEMLFQRALRQRGQK